MKLHAINTGLFKLDGGAMFGVVPKSLWNNKNKADENNMCTWALRCLLIEFNNRLILVDNGIGNKQDAKFFSHYYLSATSSVESELNKLGFTSADVTDVLLTHLHFDHCGGSVLLNANGKLELAFKNAKYWSNSVHWEWAIQPNAREKASFLKENIFPIQESGQLNFIDEGQKWYDGIEIYYSNGHTEGMMIPIIDTGLGKIAFCADLIPSSWHVPLPWIMAYDMKPLITLKEKSDFLQKAVEEDIRLFFEHDPIHELASIVKNEKGQITITSFDSIANL